jgi:hypothetical protein
MMSIFGKPDFEAMRRAGDWPRLIHWALYEKDREASRAALASLRKDVPAVVEHVYESACWAQEHAVGRRKMLPTRSVRLLDEGVKALVRLGPSAVEPVATAVKAYDDYAGPDEETRFLFFLLMFEVLERIGRSAAERLRELAEDRNDDVARQSREVLARLRDRGLLDDDNDDTGTPRRV